MSIREELSEAYYRQVRGSNLSDLVLREIANRKLECHILRAEGARLEAGKKGEHEALTALERVVEDLGPRAFPRTRENPSTRQWDLLEGIAQTLGVKED